jgi:large subunit ribosomal protein L18
MSAQTKYRQHTQRKQRVRAKIAGTATRPRLSVFISNRQVRAQLIDDTGGNTIAASSSSQTPGTMMAKATWVGEDIAKKAGAAKIKQIVFDRSGHRYHGRIKALAEAARKGGLEF